MLKVPPHKKITLLSSLCLAFFVTNPTKATMAHHPPEEDWCQSVSFLKISQEKFTKLRVLKMTGLFNRIEHACCGKMTKPSEVEGVYYTLLVHTSIIAWYVIVILLGDEADLQHFWDDEDMVGICIGSLLIWFILVISLWVANQKSKRTPVLFFLTDTGLLPDSSGRIYKYEDCLMVHKVKNFEGEFINIAMKNGQILQYKSTEFASNFGFIYAYNYLSEKIGQPSPPHLLLQEGRVT